MRRLLVSILLLALLFHAVAAAVYFFVPTWSDTAGKVFSFEKGLVGGIGFGGSDEPIKFNVVSFTPEDGIQCKKGDLLSIKFRITNRSEELPWINLHATQIEGGRGTRSFVIGAAAPGSTIDSAFNLRCLPSSDASSGGQSFIRYQLEDSDGRKSAGPLMFSYMVIP